MDLTVENLVDTGDYRSCSEIEVDLAYNNEMLFFTNAEFSDCLLTFLAHCTHLGIKDLEDRRGPNVTLEDPNAEGDIIVSRTESDVISDAAPQRPRRVPVYQESALVYAADADYTGLYVRGGMNARAYIHSMLRIALKNGIWVHVRFDSIPAVRNLDPRSQRMMNSHGDPDQPLPFFDSGFRNART